MDLLLILVLQAAALAGVLLWPVREPRA